MPSWWPRRPRRPSPSSRSSRAAPDPGVLSWRERELLVLDVETTGLDLDADEVISYGAVPIIDGRILVAESSYGLVRPQRPPGAAAAAVTGITSAELEQAPAAAAAAAELARLLDGRVLVAHAAWVELAFVTRLLGEHGQRWPSWPAWPQPVLDTAALARACHLTRAQPEAALRARGGAEPGLEALAEQLRVPVHTPHHALGDALTTAGVLQALLARLERDRDGEVLTIQLLERLSRRYSAR